MIIQLTHRTLLKLTGSEVQSFLQGQFSNDINALEDDVIQLNAYCQHQGKIMALIWVMINFIYPFHKPYLQKL
jgi:folate-binding Fe-S cluster repair protein YgfZ